jgi:hypothetical protein
MREEVKKYPDKKLTVTIHYNDLIELTRLISMMRKTVVGGSSCRHEDYRDGNYSMIVENLNTEQFCENLTILEEPDFVLVKPRVEIIGGKVCHFYLSKMDELT